MGKKKLENSPNRREKRLRIGRGIPKLAGQMGRPKDGSHVDRNREGSTYWLSWMESMWSCQNVIDETRSERE